MMMMMMMMLMLMMVMVYVFSNEIDTILHIVLINNTVIIVTITNTWPLFITVLHYCHYYNNYLLVLSF